MSIKKALRKAWGRWMKRDKAIRTPRDVRAVFRLSYGGLPIGVLEAQGGRWLFRYTEEFRKQKRVRPIVEFPDVGKVYESGELWPFFAMRIPSLKQTAVLDVVKNEQIDRKNEVQLLRRFGKRTINNPFELIEG